MSLLLSISYLLLCFLFSFGDEFLSFFFLPGDCGLMHSHAGDESVRKALVKGAPRLVNEPQIST